MTEQELNSILQLIQSGVNINADEKNKVAELLEQMNKKQVIENHPYKIRTLQRNGTTYFITYVYDETKKDKRKQISAKTRENLDNKIYDDYKSKTLLTFEKVSLEWLHYYKTTVKDTTFDRTMSDYKRFISKCSFFNKSITAIKPIDIKEYLQKTIKIGRAHV